MIEVRLKDTADLGGQALGGIGAAAKVVLIDSSTGLPYVAGGGSGGGAEDLLFTDDTGAQFIYRDSGATPPVFTAYLIPAGTAYTVGANPRPYAVRDVNVSTLFAGERPLIDQAHGGVMAVVRDTTPYVTVAASQTNQVLTNGGAGALGDQIVQLTIVVTTEATSTVSLTDGTGTGTALNGFQIFPANMGIGTYTICLENLVSISGPWKVTTGAGVSVLAHGIFS